MVVRKPSRPVSTSSLLRENIIRCALGIASGLMLVAGCTGVVGGAADGSRSDGGAAVDGGLDGGRGCDPGLDGGRRCDGGLDSGGSDSGSVDSGGNIDGGTDAGGPGFTVTRPERQRLIVLTDITNEPDDQQSLVRLLVYANQLDIEALIATTSTWHRSSPVPGRIRDLVNAYGSVRASLERHEPGWPTATALLGLVAEGQTGFGMSSVGDGWSTEGSRAIIAAADRSDPRPLWISMWGGANTLAQALWDVRTSRSAAEVAAFVARLRVYSISDQDNAGQWLRAQFPELLYIVSPSRPDSSGGDDYGSATWDGFSGDRFKWPDFSGPDFGLVDNDWVRRHINDPGVSGENGALADWYPQIQYLMEGDTPSFLNLLQNGLASYESPSYGGWGGRYARYTPCSAGNPCVVRDTGETRPIWTDTFPGDTVVGPADGVVHTSHKATIWRWREAYQWDFAARIAWCTRDRDSANHNPTPAFSGDTTLGVVHISARSGEPVVLDASGTMDRDGDAVTLRWSYYAEAGTFSGAITIEDAETRMARFTAPDVDRAGQTIHIILEVTDDGTPPLSGFRRIVVSVQPGASS